MPYSLHLSLFPSCGTTTFTWLWPSSPRSRCSWRTSRVTKEPRSSTSEYGRSVDLRDVLIARQHSVSRLNVIHRTKTHRDTQHPMPLSRGCTSSFFTLLNKEEQPHSNSRGYGEHILCSDPGIRQLGIPSWN